MTTEPLKTKILAVSLPLFIEHGYKKVTYKQIADAVGISKSLLQYHYPQKSQLMADLMNVNFNQWLNTIPEGDLYTRLTAFLLMFFDFISTNKAVNGLMTEIIANNELFNAFMTFFSNWLADNNFVKHDDNKVKAALLFAVSGGLQLYRFKDSLMVPVEQVTHTIIATLLTIVGKSSQLIDSTFHNAETLYQQLRIKGWQLVY